MSNNKSPFYIIDEFVSPLQCEDIISRLGNKFPQFDSNENVLCTPKVNTLTEMRLMPHIKDLIPELEKYYGFEYAGTTRFIFNWYPKGYSDQSIICDNSTKTKNGWKKTKEYDFSGMIFLNDYQSETPFDPYFEVNGGKHEFVTHKFGFNPKRGTLIIHPSGPNFTYSISPILEGELNVMRFNITAVDDYKYDMNNFRGNYKTWFNH